MADLENKDWYVGCDLCYTKRGWMVERELLVFSEDGSTRKGVGD